MTPEIEDAITRAAQEQGIDPSFALAVAQRESNFNPNARASRSMYGLFQVSGPLRAQYGIGDSSDPYTQASGWGHFINDTRKDLTQRLGRDPTNEETYLAHYFGTGRAARLISGQVPPSADVRDVFTPQEIQANPEIAKAGTVGTLVANVEGDIGGRIGKFGGQGTSMYTNVHSGAGPDFASFGQPQGGDQTAAGAGAPREQPVDFAALGAAQTPVITDTGAAAAQQPAQPSAGEPAPPASPAPPAVNPAQVAMRNAVAQQTAPQVQGIPAIPGQQPAMPQQQTSQA